MATAKNANYSAEQVTLMVERYMAVRDQSEEVRTACVKELAAELGKKDRSIIAKLSRERNPENPAESLYVAKQVVSKVTGEEPAKKLELATRFQRMTGIPVNPENLAKANKTDLVALVAYAKANGATDEVADEVAEVDGESIEAAS